MRWRLFLAAHLVVLAAVVYAGVQKVDAARSLHALQPCPGRAHFDNEYRWTNGLIHRACATAYASWEPLSSGGGVACGGRLNDASFTTAVSANVPILND